MALNAIFLHYPHSGTGRYLDRLVAGGQDLARFSLLGARAFPPDEDASWRDRVHLVGSPFDRRRALAKVWLEQVGIPAAARVTGADLHHVPYFAPPLVPRLPTVVTVHDLVPLLQSAYRRTAAQRLYTALACLGLRSAAMIVTDSRASADDLERRLRVSAARIRVVPLAVDPRFRPLDRDEEEWATSVRARYGLDGPYFLYLGGFDHRKNLATLVAAFARLRRSGAAPHRLALAGPLRPGDDFFYDPRPDLQRLGIADAVVLIDRPDDAAARALHAQADAFVFPSRYEGFGLPPLEAMACGAPVVCSRASSLPEVVGDAALLFDPDDVDSLAAILARVAADPDLRRDLSAGGRQRAARFTWEATAAATVEVYREVLNGTGRNPESRIQNPEGDGQ